MTKSNTLISIVIPACNEEKYIQQTILALRERSTSSCDLEIIVVDGGSVDQTVTLASDLGAIVINALSEKKGRAQLLNEGVQAAKGSIYLFCDADSLVPYGYDADILHVLKEDSVVGGAFEFTLEGTEFGLRVVEFINRSRYRIWKRYYGDQGIFVKANIFHHAGGYPDLGLMEASEFCVALAREGKLKLIKKPMLTSARRFIEGGIYKVLWFDVRMWWLNLLGRNTEKFAKGYWQNQYS